MASLFFPSFVLVYVLGNTFERDTALRLLTTTSAWKFFAARVDVPDPFSIGWPRVNLHTISQHAPLTLRYCPDTRSWCLLEITSRVRRIGQSERWQPWQHQSNYRPVDGPTITLQHQSTSTTLTGYQSWTARHTNHSSHLPRKKSSILNLPRPFPSSLQRLVPRNHDLPSLTTTRRVL